MTIIRRPARRFQQCYFVYILASLRGVLYVGLTDDLRQRILQHKEGTFDGFTKKYNVNRLMYFEAYTGPKLAAARELQIKKFRREKKIALFAESNPQWKDLTPEIFESIGVASYARVALRLKSRTPRDRGVHTSGKDLEHERRNPME